MEQVILFLLTYIVVFIVYNILLSRKTKKKKKDKANKPIEVIILESRYKIDIEKLNYKRLLLVISIVSSLDITIIITLILLLDSYILQLLVALVLTFPMILCSYHFIGRYYQKRRMIKDE